MATKRKLDIRLKGSVERFLSALLPEERYFAEIGRELIKHSNRLSALDHLGIYEFRNSDLCPALLVGMFLYEAGNLQYAMKYYRIAAQAAETVPSEIAKILIANTFKIRGSNSAAIASFMQVNPDLLNHQLRSAVFKGLGSAHRDCADYSEAEKYLNKALEIAPHNYRYHFSKGYLYHHAPELGSSDKSHFQKAFESYQRALEMGGEQWGVLHFHLALVSGHLRNKIEMRRHLATAIQLFSRTKSFHDDVNRALALILLDSYDEGISVLRNALSFCDVEATECAIKNATALLNDKELSGTVANLIERYRNFLLDRLADLEGRNIYKQGEWDGSETNIESRIISAVVVFVDVRGFTKLIFETSESDHIAISKMLGEYYNMCVEIMYPVTCYTKFVGDGMMMVSRIYGDNPAMVAQQIHQCLSCVTRLETAFRAGYLYKEKGVGLGVGIALGSVVRLRTREGHFDYVGNTVNLSARLCDQARPSGIVMNADAALIGNEVLSRALEDAKRAVGPVRELSLRGIKGIGKDAIRVFSTASFI